jgi:Protein of unknown function (DUF3429)
MGKVRAVLGVDNMRRRDIAPKGPWVLGLAGLIPFFAALVGGQLAPAPFDGVCVTILFAYGAIILSFLGGTRWGFEVGARPEGPGFFTLLFSVIPSLLAVIAAISQYQAPLVGLGILIAGFIIMWIWDYATSGGSTRRWPLWYRPLRTVLTLGACVAIGTQIWFTMH